MGIFSKAIFRKEKIYSHQKNMPTLCFSQESRSVIFYPMGVDIKDKDKHISYLPLRI